MNQNTLKKEFKKKCRTEMASCYRYQKNGTILAMVGFLVVLIVALLIFTTDLFENLFPLDIVLLGVGFVITAGGAILDIIGDAAFKKEFQAYLKSRQQG